MGEGQPTNFFSHGHQLCFGDGGGASFSPFLPESTVYAPPLHFLVAGREMS